MSLPKLIVVDDEVDLAEFVCEVAEMVGFKTEQFHDAGKFKDQYNKSADVLILDLMMPGVDGIEIIRYLAEINCNAQLILVSGFDQSVLYSAQKLAIERGLNFAGSLGKPFRQNELHELLSGLSISPKISASSKNIEPPPVSELSKALKNNELVVYYQPKIGIKADSMPAVEALVRWQHPVYGLIGPDLFIPTAEKNNLIDELTLEVLNQSMRNCREWMEQGLTAQVAINMSTNTLKELDLPEKMGQLIEKYGLDASQIVLEITETTLMQELINSLDILTRLRMKGFRLSIDDFGTGYSSMVQLHRAPFSEIKIDQSFVSAMENDEEAATIVETIIMLGHKLNMKTVAEGVETESCFKGLENMDCDQAQGYLFSKPIPADEIVTWFTEKNNQSKL